MRYIPSQRAFLSVYARFQSQDYIIITKIFAKLKAARKHEKEERKREVNKRYSIV